MRTIGADHTRLGQDLLPPVLQDASITSDSAVSHAGAHQARPSGDVDGGRSRTDDPGTDLDDPDAESVDTMHVAAGIIITLDNRFVLVTRRRAGTHKGGFWEFPGGKVEAGETTEVALARELEEELGIVPYDTESFCRVSHRYIEHEVRIDFRLVRHFLGHPRGVEGQMIGWFAIRQLCDMAFPEANLPVIEKLESLPVLSPS